MTIKWFSPNKSLPILTLAKYGISFNISSIEMLKNAKSLTIGCDLEKKDVFIKLNFDEKEQGFAIPKIDENTKTLRVNCKDFIQYIETKCKLDLTNSKKYYLEYDEQKKLVFFNLSHQINDARKKKRGDKNE